MVKVRLFLLPLILAVLLAPACKKGIKTTSGVLTNVPSDVTAVTYIDINSLMEKADFEETRQMEFYQDMLAEVQEDNPAVAKILEDPKSSGIDLKQPAYLTHYVNPDNMEEIFMGLAVSLKDKKAFANFLKDAGIKSEAKEGYQLASGNESSLLAWNNGMALLGFYNPYMDGEAIVGKFFNATKETSIAGNQDLLTSMEGNHDIKSWVTLDPVLQSDQAKMTLAMAGIGPEGLSKNYIHASGDFKDGKMVSSSKWFLKKELTKDISKLFKDKPKKDLTPYIPGDDLSSLTSGALDLAGLHLVLNSQPMYKNAVNFYLKEYGVSIEDIVTTFGGDLAVGMYPSSQSPAMSLVAVSDIKDAKGFQKFIDLAVERSLLTKESDGTYLVNSSSVGYPFSNPFSSASRTQTKLLVKDDIFVITNKEGATEAIASGKVEKMEKEVADLANSNVVGIYLSNLAGNAMTPEMFDGLEDELEGMKLSVTGKGMDYLLEMKDKNTNSLKSFMKILNEGYLKSKGRFDVQ